MIEDNEDKIIERVKSGDCDAFCELVEKYKNKAASIAYSLCANYEDARDLSQEAFIKAFKTIRHFKAHSKFYTWFYRILVNMCKDYLRGKKRNMMVNRAIRFKVKDGSLETEDIFEHVASSDPGPEEALLNKELRQHLTEAISSLSEKQRTVFTLRNIHGLKIAEIAQITRCATGTIKAHLFKATANLQNKLEAYIKVGASGGAR